jgi:predicted ATPase
MDIKDIRKRLDKKQLLKDQAEHNLQTLTADQDNFEQSLTLHKEADCILKEVAVSIQKAVHEAVSKLVTKCLQTVFEEPWEFHFDFRESYNKIGTFYYLKKDDLIIDDLLNTTGGGVVDIVSFGLRVAAVMLKQPKTRKLLVLDEPFRFLSEAYRPNIANLLKELSMELDMQIIMVTHFSEFMLGKVHKIRN